MRNYQAGDRIELEMPFAPIDETSLTPDGFIKGVASTPSTDLYGHKVLKGAFDHSVRRKGLSGPKGVKLLAHHDWQKPAGVIKRLETVGDKLEIDAQLNLQVSYVKDVYEVAKQNGGLSFSVGFTLEDFEFVDEKSAKSNDDAYLIIKSGDLMEVSVVCFPACVDAEMTFIKQADTPSEFERALMANGWAHGRNEAQKLHRLIKNSIHLFEPPVLAASKTTPARPVLDAHQLKAATDLTARVKALLGAS
jgi:HK97 family phage prohead protease